MEHSEKSTGRESDKFMLRLPDGMREKIAEAAKSNGRSMNAEIVARLEASNAAPTAPEILGLIARQEKEIQLAKLERDSLLMQAMQQSLGLDLAITLLPKDVILKYRSEAEVLKRLRAEGEKIIEESRSKLHEEPGLLNSLRRVGDKIFTWVDKKLKARDALDELPSEDPTKE